MPDLVAIETQIEARLLEVDRRLYLQDAVLTLLRPVAPSGLQATVTLADSWFPLVGESTREEDVLIFQVSDLQGDLEGDLDGVKFARMLGVNYEVQRIERPKPGKPRIYLIYGSVKKYVVRNFKLPT